MIDLFDNLVSHPRNLLPKDGTVNYYGTIMSLNDAVSYFNNLLNKIEWENDVVIVYGKRIVTKRKVAWYGDKNFKYTYSNSTKLAIPWIKELLEIKELVEKQTGEEFNSCLINLYHDGSEGMAWHSDNERELKQNGAIASVSFGAERNFSFKHQKSNEKVSLILQNGSLLIMKNETQQHWVHCLPTSKKIILPRINLTFRTIIC